MSAPDALVHTELDGVTYLVGHLWIRESRRGTFGATFQYADAWLEKGGRTVPQGTSGRSTTSSVSPT